MTVSDSSTILETIAGFVQYFELETLPPETLDRLELHFLDTLGALHAGRELPEARAVRELTAESSPLCANVATVRVTEADDIHLTSCTTPGSVVVPTALALELTSPRAFLEALAVGYELMLRLGLAIDGPHVLARGIWPTLFGAPLVSASMASRAFELSLEQTRGALATALALTTGTAIRPGSTSPGGTSRWLTLGWAAESGLLAAKAARSGIEGTDDLLERLDFRVAGTDVSESLLVAELGVQFRLDELGLKPYPVARQALAAVEACRELARFADVDADAIEAIGVEVPSPQRAVIDRPGVPETRFESIVSVQYQSALAIVAPNALQDVARSPLFVNETVTRLMSRIRVVSSSALEPLYPGHWPARVSLERSGETLEREVLSPRGDAGSDFGWDDVVEKYRVVPWVAELAPSVRRLHELAALPRLVYWAT